MNLGAFALQHNRYVFLVYGFAGFGLSQDVGKVGLRRGSVNGNAIETVQNKCVESHRAGFAERRNFPQ